MLKFIAAGLMLIDHIGLLFYPEHLLLRYIGRLAMPIFAYGVAEGFYYTSSLKNYIRRLVMFALVSQVPFWMMLRASGQRGWYTLQLNIGVTFVLSLFVLKLIRYIEEQAQHEMQKIGALIGIFGLLVVAEVVGCDYGSYGIFTVLLFYKFYVVQKRPQTLAVIWFVITVILGLLGQVNIYAQLFAIFAIPLIAGVKERKSSKTFRYFFYLFYPLHMLILALIRDYIVK